MLVPIVALLLQAASTVSTPIVVAAPVAADAAAYLAIAGPDRLMGVTCDCAERVEIHHIVRGADGVKMKSLVALDVPPEGIVIRPGSDLHLMLMGLKQPLVEGRHVTLELRFARAGALRTSFRIVTDSRAAWSAAQP